MTIKRAEAKAMDGTVEIGIYDGRNERIGTRHLPAGDVVDMTAFDSPREATTIVRVATNLAFGSTLLALRFAAWLLSQTCAMKTASRPNTTAKPIMTMVLARTTKFP